MAPEGQAARTPNARRGPSPKARALAFLAAAAVLALLLALPVPEGLRKVHEAVLDERGRRALAILAAALVLWMTEALPFHVTGLLAMLGLALSGAGEWRAIVRTGFGDDVVVFFIGVLALAACIVRSGLGRRLSLLVLSLTGGSTRAVVLGFLAASAALSMWVTALAASAMLMPLARGLLEDEGAKPGESRFGAALMMAVAWGALVGALGTPAGSGSNPVVVRFLAEIGHLELGFLDWMAFGLPAVILLVPAAWLTLVLLFPPELPRLARSREDIAASRRAQGPFSRDEKATLAVFLLTVLAWIAGPLAERALHAKLPISMAAAAATVLLFLPGATSFKWKELEREMDWSGIILIATGIGLGTALYDTGAAGWLAALVFGGIGGLPLYPRLVLVVAGVLAVKVALSSNTLTGTIIVPLVLALAPFLGSGATGLALAAGLAANLAVILVTTSPVNVVPWSTGYFSLADMARAGLLFAPVAAVVLAAVVLVVGGARGLF